MSTSSGTRRALHVYDHKGRCIHVGSVVAPSDADGLRAVLSGPPPCDLEASRHYRVRVGSAVASSAGDEFHRTAGNTGLSEKDGADLERREHDEREAQRVRAEAEGALKGFLKDKLAARKRERELEQGPFESSQDWHKRRVRELGAVVDAAAKIAPHLAGALDPDAYVEARRHAADTYGYSVGLGGGGQGGGAVFSGALCDFSRPGPFETSWDQALWRIRFQETRRCSKCGDYKIGLQDYSDDMARRIPPADLEREARELIDDCFRTTSFPCRGVGLVYRSASGVGGITGIQYDPRTGKSGPLTGSGNAGRATAGGSGSAGPVYIDEID